MRRLLRILGVVACVAVTGFVAWYQIGSIDRTLVEPTSVVASDSQQSEQTSALDSPSSYSWDEAQAPEYISVSDGAEIDWSLDAGAVSYGVLDELGRATEVRACLTHGMVVAASEDRDPVPQELKPSGWGHNEKVEIVCPDGHIYTGWFWNRSHLLADSLGGVPTLENLVCGTRMQNVASNDNEGGMRWIEYRVSSWLWRHENGTVLFSAKPLYEGDELVCRAVAVDARSSDDEIDVHVIVYNAAKGYEINYVTGEFSPSE